MKKVIINIHGFNSGPGGKLLELQKQFPDCEVIAPQLPYDPLQAIKVLRDMVNSHKHTDVHIIGTSLGAFYTMYLSTLYSERNNFTYYLINPSFEPHNTFRRYEGEVLTNFKTQEQFQTTPEFFSSLATLYDTIKLHYNAHCIHSSNYFIGTKDEVVDFSSFIDFIKLFDLPYRIYYSEQGHRFEDMSMVVQKVRGNMIF